MKYEIRSTLLSEAENEYEETVEQTNDSLLVLKLLEKFKTDEDSASMYMHESGNKFDFFFLNGQYLVQYYIRNGFYRKVMCNSGS